MMSIQYSIVLVLTVVAGTLAFTAEYIPKSFYVIHSNGEQSPVVYLRQKRSLQEALFPLVRMRRSGDGGSGSGSGSYSSSSSYSGAGAGANDAIHFVDNLATGFDMVAKLAGFPNGFPGGIPGGIHGAGGVGGYPGGAGGAGAYPGGAGGAGAYPDGAGGSGCSSCGGGGYGGDAAGVHGAVPNFQTRFGGDDGVSYTGSAQGAKGVYSASSSSIDSDGNVKYSVKTGKY